MSRLPEPWELSKNDYRSPYYSPPPLLCEYCEVDLNDYDGETHELDSWIETEFCCDECYQENHREELDGITNFK